MHHLIVSNNNYFHEFVNCQKLIIKACVKGMYRFRTRQDSCGQAYMTEASKDLMRFNATPPEKRSTNSTCISHYPLAYFTAV